MNPLRQFQTNLTRRTFLGTTAGAIGQTALTTLLGPRQLAHASGATGSASALPALPHFTPKAKRVLCLFQSEGFSHVDLFDHKPTLDKHHGQEIPPSVKGTQRLTGMTSGQGKYPVVAPMWPGRRCGQHGTWISSLLPHTQTIADDICIVKSMYTEAINHDPAITFFQTGAQLAGRPSIGSWLSYGLGSENHDLPAFVALLSNGTGNPNDQPLYDRLWSSGFLPTKHQGIKFRAASDPVLFLSNPAGFDASARRRMLDDLSALNQIQSAEFGDPEITTRISQYELAYRMQTSVPELMDVSHEPESVFELYGPEARRPGTFAANCLLARRLAERGVRFIQLFHRGWDQHTKLPTQIAGQCRDTDQPSAALVKDLKQRGLLDDTLVVWGGEFGRTVYCQGRLTQEDYGRDHHPRCFTLWVAGGGIRPGLTYGETDEFCYNIVRDPVDVHDLHATLLHCLGIDHTRLTFKFQGRHHRLTDVHGNVVKGLLA
jgi:hypothetical protein